jgi:hypothetical protein
MLVDYEAADRGVAARDRVVFPQLIQSVRNYSIGIDRRSPEIFL